MSDSIPVLLDLESQSDSENSQENIAVSRSGLDWASELTQVIVIMSDNKHEQLASIARIVKEKDLESLHEFGGIQGIAEALATDLNNGIPESNGLCHQRIASTNTITEVPAKAFIWYFLSNLCNDWTSHLLRLSLLLSFIYVIVQERFSHDWHAGVIILVCLLISAATLAVTDYHKLQISRQFGKHNDLLESGGMVVEVIREGRRHQIPVSDVLLGDVVCLGRRHFLPADGLLISGELSVFDGCSYSTVNDQNPFLFYGSKVVNGNGRMIVTSMGENTVWGEMMSGVNESKKTPLLAQLDKLIACTNVIGLVVSCLITVIMTLLLIVTKENHKSQLPSPMGKPKIIVEIMDSIDLKTTTSKITTLATFLIGVKGGFPFILSIAIKYWGEKTLCGKASAKQSSACVSMGSLTTIITDKTGGLTLEPLEVDTLRIGGEIISEDTTIDANVQDVLCDGISMSVLQSPCTRMDSLLLPWATQNLGLKLETLNQMRCIGVMTKEENRNEVGHGVLIKKNRDSGAMCMHWRGHPTTILTMCSLYTDSEGVIHGMDAQKRDEFQQSIKDMQSTTIAFACSLVDAPVLRGRNLIFLGMVGLKERCLQDTKDTVEILRNAGVDVKLVSGYSDLQSLENIARQCGLLQPNSDAIVIDGETFRTWTDEERKEKVEKISVIGNALPSDKHLLVTCLKEKDQVVAVVAVTTNEASALKEAHVGIAMGNWSTKIARETSDIFIFDDDFNFLAKIINDGRCTHKNILSYIQHVLITFASGLALSLISPASKWKITITTIPFFWINLMGSVLCGLALLTVPPAEKIMQNLPRGRTRRLITNSMWRNISTQTLYQTSILVTFCLKGKALLSIDNDEVIKTAAFYSFALCQVFNILIAREPEVKNVFKGIHHHIYFWVVIVFTIGLLEAYTFLLVGNDAKLNWENRAVCFLIGALCLVVDWIAKCKWVGILPPNLL